MDETFMKELKDTILKAINSGLAFAHMTERERNHKEKEIVDFLNSKGYEAFVEDKMIHILNKQWEKILMMELTRNTLYFTPVLKSEVTVVIYYILQLVSKRYLDKTPPSKGKKEKVLKKEEKGEDSDEDTEEEPKPPPDFNFL
jgi:hypothetical protein|tara:strand:+ start:85 stop:513 length:429 start_codon:yes stop_codon:yes gene_type:complete